MRARRGDRGESLVELLISIVIMGIAFPPILTALATTTKGSGDHRSQTELGTRLREAAEQVQDPAANPWPALPPKSCPSSVSLPAGATATLQFYKDDELDPANRWRNDQSWAATTVNGCQLLKVTLTVTDADGDTESIVVTRRKP